MKRPLCFALAAVALVGLALSLIAHVSTFIGYNLIRSVPWVWSLHVGIFAVFIPAILLGDQKAPRQHARLADSFPHAPRWMANLVRAFFAYAFINFALCMVQMPFGKNAHRPVERRFPVEATGQAVAPKATDEHAVAITLRAFSGHWMLFYAMAASTLVSAANSRRPQVPRNAVVRRDRAFVGRFGTN